MTVHSKIIHSKSTEDINVADDEGSPTGPYDTEMSLPAHLMVSHSSARQNKRLTARVGVDALSRFSDPLTQSLGPSSLSSRQSSLSSFPFSLSSRQSSQSSIPLILCDDGAVENPLSRGTDTVSHGTGADGVDGPRNERPERGRGDSRSEQPQVLRGRRGTYLKAVTSSQIKFGDNGWEDHNVEKQEVSI